MDYTIDLLDTQPHNLVETKRHTCPSWVKVTRVCGGINLVRATCGDPFCTTCQKIKAERAIERWKPEIDTWSNTKFVTLTLKSDHDLDRQIDDFYVAFRAFMHTSLGSVNWPKFCDQAIKHIDEKCEKSAIRGKIRNRQRSRLKMSLNRLGRKIEAIRPFKDGLVRVRDLFEKGVRVHEVTHGDKGFHFHCHILAFIASLIA